MQSKDMKRTDWGRVLRKDYIARDFRRNGHQGRMSLSILRELTAPLTIHYPFGDVLIADEGFGWLQIALKEQSFWITAMYDRQGQRISLYFDVTAGNCFDNPDNPCFADLYLDIVAIGDVLEVLDRDELQRLLRLLLIDVLLPDLFLLIHGDELLFDLLSVEVHVEVAVLVYELLNVAVGGRLEFIRHRSEKKY